MKLSPATPDDARALGTILSDWIDATPWMPRLHTREADLAFVANLIATSEVTVAREPGPVGFLARLGSDITALYLAPAARGRGIGKALLDRAKAEVPRLCLWTFRDNVGARAFYARERFRETARTYGDNDEGLPDMHLEWERAG